MISQLSVGSTSRNKIGAGVVRAGEKQDGKQREPQSGPVPTPGRQGAAVQKNDDDAVDDSLPGSSKTIIETRGSRKEGCLMRLLIRASSGCVAREARGDATADA